MQESREYIGVDFDGTLARRTYGDDVGKPILKMISRIKDHLRAGEKVKVFTARTGSDNEKKIKKFCKDHLGCELEITNQKDPFMKFFYDDKARQVIPDTGELVKENSRGDA